MVFFNCQVAFIGMCSGHWSTAMCDHPLQMGQWRFVWTWPVLWCFSVDPTQNVGYHLMPLKTCDCHRMNSGFASIDYAKTPLFPAFPTLHVEQHPSPALSMWFHSSRSLAQHACAGVTLELNVAPRKSDWRRKYPACWPRNKSIGFVINNLMSLI